MITVAAVRTKFLHISHGFCFGWQAVMKSAVSLFTTQVACLFFIKYLRRLC
jgi:hypothetical protein